MRLGSATRVRRPARRHRARAGGRPARVPLRVDVRGVRHGRGHADGMDRRDDRADRVGSAIMQMPARSPAATATTVATLDILSGGRVLLGLGTSGPAGRRGLARPAMGQAARRAPASTSRSCARSSAARSRSSTTASTTTSPTAAPGATGLGKPLKIIVHPARARGADLPGGDRPEERRAHGRDRRRLAADLLLAGAGAPSVHGPALEEGFALRGGRPDGWDLAPLVPVLMDDDVQACRDFLKPMLALYVGGMGARGQNFYNRLAQRYGFEAEAADDPGSLPRRPEGRGGRGRARRARRRDRPRRRPRDGSPTGSTAWRESGATTLVLQARQPEALQALAELAG